MAEEKARSFLEVAADMARRQGRAWRLGEAKEQDHGVAGERRREAEGRSRADPTDEGAAEGGPCRKGDAARELEAPVRRSERLGSDHGGHERGSRDAIRNRARGANEAEKRKERKRQQSGEGEKKHRQERERAHPLGKCHQVAAGGAVGEKACRDREEEEGQGLGRLQQACFTRARAECEDGDDGGRREPDLLGGLREEIR